MPRLSVIILTYDGRRWLPACLDAMRSQRNAPEFETLVVDNGSTDDSVAIIRRDYPWVRLVESSTNRGFAGGNNFGVSAAHGEWLVAHLPRAEAVWVEGNHFGPKGEPEEELLAWLVD